MKATIGIGSVIGLIIASTVSAAVRRVPSDYPTIQSGIDACIEGDIVLVAPGVYTGTGNRDIRVGKSITIKSEQGPLTCIIDCNGTRDEYHYGFGFGGVNPVLEGFTITRVYDLLPEVGAVNCHDAGAIIRNCIISGNRNRTKGAGILALDSDVSISNCIITGNVAATGINQAGQPSFSYGGGVFCRSSGNAVFRNCIISGNKADFGGALAWTGTGTARFENCIIYGNQAALGQGTQAYAGLAGALCPAWGCPSIGAIAFASCCIDDDPNAFYYEKPSPGAPDEVFRLDNCIVTSPGFAKPGCWDPHSTPDDPNDDFWVDGDYHLKSQAGRWDPQGQRWVQDGVTSPCIDAGDPSSPVGQEPFPNGGIINAGAYGGTPEASKSYFGEPICETVVAGDINGDCKVDFTDFELLGCHWLADSSL